MMIAIIMIITMSIFIQYFIQQNDETGYLAENSDNMKEFSSQVKKLVEDKELRQRMGTAGVDFAQTLSWEAATSKLRNVQYRRAIQLHKQARDEKGRYIKDIELAIMKR